MPESNANFAFVMRALELAQDKAAFILPCGSLSSSSEKNIRKYFIDSNLLSAVLLLPQKMFESTSIPTCIFLFDKNKKYPNVVFMDLREQTVREERLQRGQYGGKCHENRVYKKYFESMSDEKIAEIAKIIKDRQDLPEWAVIATNEAIAEQDYILTPNRYLPCDDQDNKNRPLEYIVDDLNNVVELRNVLKLVINEKKSRDLGLYDIYEAHESSKKATEGIKELIEKLTGKKLIEPDYIALSKNRNEITFQNNHPALVSEILLSIFQMWKQHIMFLNNQENIYLAELRDALLPKLMNGEIVL